MRVLIDKSARRLTLTDGARVLLIARVALGREPIGPKRASGDGRTPEGRYRVCIEKEQGKYGLSLGLSYPGPEDARLALAEGRIDPATCDAILLAHAQGRRPPWGTPLGGEIYLHEGPTDRDWTAGCVALSHENMAALFERRHEVEEVVISP